jgi:hypothetical protein
MMNRRPPGPATPDAFDLDREPAMATRDRAKLRMLNAPGREEPDDLIAGLIVIFTYHITQIN